MASGHENNRDPLITVREPSGEERRWRVRRRTIRVGRSADCDLVLDDPRVSRHHALLEWDGDEVLFRNLSETNPAFLNGRRCFRSRMVEGDALQLGDSHLVLSGHVDLPSPSEPEAGTEEAAPTPRESESKTVVGGGIERARLALLSEIVEVLSLEQDRATFLDRVLRALFRILDVRRVLVALRHDADAEPVVVARHNRERTGGPFTVSRTISSRVLESGRAFLTGNARADETVRDAESVAVQELTSVLCVPIQQGGTTVGFLYGDNRFREHSFSEDDLRFMQLIARVLSVQLENRELARSLRNENSRLREMIEGRGEMVAVSAPMRQILRLAHRAAASDANILISGETGTGKNLLARTIHRLSPRAERPYLECSCAAIPRTLLEAELFGYGPMSGISGADPKGRAGYFEAAGEGTILLDEIGDMDQRLQAKMLHALEGGTFRRLGSNEGRKVRCRIIAASNQDLETMVRDGRFRADLFYRLRVVPLHIPPLRERPEDIVPVARALLKRMATGKGTRLTPAAERVLLAHPWPGNVRELRNALARVLALGSGPEVDPDLLRGCLDEQASDSRGEPILPLEEVQRRHILRVLRLLGGNKTRAAEALHISRSTLYDWLKEPDVRNPDA